MLLPPHPARCSLALGATLSHNKGRGKAKASVRQALSISQFARPKIAPRRTIVVRAEKNDHQRPLHIGINSPSGAEGRVESTACAVHDVELRSIRRVPGPMTNTSKASQMQQRHGRMEGRSRLAGLMLLMLLGAALLGLSLVMLQL